MYIQTRKENRGLAYELRSKLIPPLWNPRNHICGWLDHACLPSALTIRYCQTKTAFGRAYAKEEAGPIGLGEIYSSESQTYKTC